MVVKESHFRGLLPNEHITSVDVYRERGLDLKQFFQIRSEGPCATPEEVIKARNEAFKIEGHDVVVITYLDSEEVPWNRRNAPLDGNAPQVNGKCPKSRQSKYQSDYDYGWTEMTEREQYNERKKFKREK